MEKGAPKLALTVILVVKSVGADTVVPRALDPSGERPLTPRNHRRAT
jgi:hypothetical protein